MATDITEMKRKYREPHPGEYPNQLTIKLHKEADQKYGENPGQTCATYTLEQINGIHAGTIPEATNIRSVREDSQGKGGLSLNNLMDITRGMETLKFFEQPSVVIMKHAIISGFAKQQETENQTTLFRDARDADRQSNFGGTLSVNDILTKETAEAMYELRGTSPFFVDVVAAPDFEQGVIDLLQFQSKNLRIAQFNHLNDLPKFQREYAHGLRDIKGLPTGRIGIQDPFLTHIKTIDDFVIDPAVTHKGITYEMKTPPTQEQLQDLLTAWWLNVAGVRSNGIVIVKNGRTVAVGAGQVERFGAVAQAITKGMQKAMDRKELPYDPLQGAHKAFQYIFTRAMENPFKGAVCASDAFFPFPDSLELLARVGVKAVAQPYGSERDYQVIEAANKYGIAMVATLERCFGHY